MHQSVGLETYAPAVDTIVHNTHKHLQIIIFINLHHQLHLALMMYMAPVVHTLYMYPLKLLEEEIVRKQVA